jgi:glycosidase
MSPAFTGKKLQFSVQKLLFTFCFLFFSFYLSRAQYADVYPTNWWVGMKWNKVQLLIHNKEGNFRYIKIKIEYPGITVDSIHRLENEKYVAVDITIAPDTKPGKVEIDFVDADFTQFVEWELKPRREGNGTAFAQGVTSSDFIYLIMPDRFSNGDYSNDRVPGMRDQSLNRDSIYFRHGGDIQGVINHLDYLQDLGVTTIWLTPVIENDMPRRTEHGYAFTNEYKIDPRLGGEAAYERLSDSLHKRGMKLIQDAVYNHVGSENIFFLDPPVKDWVHQWPTYTNTTFKDQSLFDPHGSRYDKKQMSDGWFTKEMPDLNQSNPYVANFLIQHAIWCVEKFGVDGWRIDTYIYNDLDFMNRCNEAIRNEYPKMTMFGETWVHGVINQSYFCQNNFNIPFKSNLIGTTDFQELFYGITPALTEKFGWTEGVNKLYTTTAQDFVYKDPMNEVIFLDNHDLPRFYSVVGEDIDKYKMGLAWLLTFRGIPEMYYGSEILMKGLTNPDGNVRLDFKGGWKEDSVNKFTEAGRNEKENEVFNYIKKLAGFRKTSSAIKTGKMMEYTPVDGLYVYFRYDESQTIMCIMNTGEVEKKIELANDYKERTKDFTNAKDVITGQETGLSFTIPPKKMMVLQLEK